MTAEETHGDEAPLSLSAGMLLLATPALDDPNFSGAVVLLLDHGPDGTLGVVLNRPTDVTVEQRLAGWEGLCQPPGVLFSGGPVASGAVMGLVRAAAEPPDEWFPVFADIGPIDLTVDPTLLVGAIAALRVFTGYAGWGSGQLASEVRTGSWWVVTAHPGDVFAEQPDRLWREVLGRQRGNLRWFATYPRDPTTN